ncbi:NUDIX domain-containing protein [Streptomyces sp. NPDC026672]|uniref:NUDIX domain-containing protein n=1 Tax=unclassified Streptomyces TaxID=2593676 RepID=UPI0033F19880
MPPLNLRHAARAVVLDEDDRVLLCRFALPDPVPRVVWATPGGGLEGDETPLAALRRELHEEVGLVLDEDPPHVWHQEVVAPGHSPGHDGVVNDYFLVRTPSFTPRGALSADQLAAEHISAVRWWPWWEIAAYRGSDLFSPRDLATPLERLITGGAPAEPVLLGL